MRLHRTLRVPERIHLQPFGRSLAPPSSFVSRRATYVCLALRPHPDRTLRAHPAIALTDNVSYPANHPPLPSPPGISVLRNNLMESGLAVIFGQSVFVCTDLAEGRFGAALHVRPLPISLRGGSAGRVGANREGRASTARAVVAASVSVNMRAGPWGRHRVVLPSRRARQTHPPMAVPRRWASLSA